MTRQPLVEGRFVEPYAVLRYRDHSEQLMFNTAATQQTGLRACARVDVEWEDDEFMVIIRKGGTQRSVRKQRSWVSVSITGLIKKYQIPLHRHPLPIHDVIDDEIWVDFSGEKARGSWNTLRRGPWAMPALQSKKSARLNVIIGRYRSLRTHPEFAQLCREVYELEKGAEECERFSHWAERALGYYIEHAYPELWDEWLRLCKLKI